MICERCGHERAQYDPDPRSVVEHDAEQCIANLRANLAESRQKELDAETRACAAEERAHDLEALLRYHLSKPK